MVDFTKIQTFDIPPDIKVLKNANAILAGENRILKIALLAGGIGSAIYLAYKLFIYKKLNYVQPKQTISTKQSAKA